MQKTRLIRLAVAAVVLAAVGAGGVVWWKDRSTREATDNAYVAAETVSVTPQTEGYVAEILVRDNEAVEPGQVLVRLDPTDAKSKLDQALAAVQASTAAVKNVDDKASLEQAMIAERAAGVTSAEAAAEQAKLEATRYGALAGRGFASDQRVQETKVSAAQTDAAVSQAKAALEAERRQASALGSSKAQSLAGVQSSIALADQARIDLDRTVIRAPVGGVVGARSVRSGQYVRPGGAMMAIVPLGRAYVIANFKETQVSRIRIGQPVEIRADAFGDKVIKGHVDSFAPATGSEFALIPVENAVGNFTKITQRLPVKIVLDEGSPLAAALRPGLSVKVRVDIQGKTGASFAEVMPAGIVATRQATAKAR
jgi:membrane fusion protein (multidrug efflux system)